MSLTRGSTYLRSAEGIDDELLESCAKAMKHAVATGGSDNYDKQARAVCVHAHVRRVTTRGYVR